MAKFMLSVLLMSLIKCDNPEKFNQLLPLKFDAWQMEGRDKIYTPQNLYDFINGGAELYLSYGFKKLTVRRYYKENFPYIEANLFDMDSSENAFGIFQHDLEDEEVGIGQGSEYGAGWLRFWKNNFFVYISAEQDVPLIKQAILALGKTISQNISTSGKKPDLLKFIPQSGMAAKSIRFFHTHQILNYHYYLANQNILHLSPQTDVIFTKYDTSSLLLIQYPDQKQADFAYHSFLNIYLPDAQPANIAKTENGTWTNIQLMDKYIVLVLDAPTESFANNLINKVIEKL